MLVNWYPGHMAKAKRMLQENLKLIDVVVEVVDARCPMATRNPDFESLFSGKDRIIILNKADLADQSVTNAWIDFFKAQGILAVEFVSTKSSMKKKAVEIISKAAEEKVARMKAKGVVKVVRAMIVGIPNVGKSTFINCVAGVSRAQVGDKPGVTRGKQWVRITPQLELMDTPGMLWPKLENELYASRLAYIGSVRDDVLNIEQMTLGLIEVLRERCRSKFELRYSISIFNEDTDADVLHAICKSRGFITSQDEFDIERGCRIILDEFRAGKICRLSLDLPSEIANEES